MRKLFLIGLAMAAGCTAQQTSVRQYLNLSDTQATAIQKLNDGYNTPWFVQQDRINAIGRELGAIFTSNAPDPGQVGSRAVEFETIRRDRVQGQTVLQKQIAALLTPEQTSAVQTLVADAGLRPLVNDAACAYLVDNPYYGQYYGLLLFSSLRSNTFVNPGLPYIPPAPTGTFCGNSNFPFSVQEYLAVTDPQVAAITGLSAAYNDYYARQQNRLTELNLEIQDLTAAPGTDSAVLGLRYAEMARIGKAITAKGLQLRSDAKAQLTADQVAKVNVLQSLQSLLNGNLINNASGCNLLPIAGSLDGRNSFCLL